MKQKHLQAALVLIVLGLGTFNMYNQETTVQLSDITLANIEASAGDAGGEGSVCYIASKGDKNTGICKAKVDETGDFCAESSWYERNDCYGNS